jgi:chromosome partitioning protein
LSEAPSFGESIINYDATSKGAANYLSSSGSYKEKQQIILWQRQ